MRTITLIFALIAFVGLSATPLLGQSGRLLVRVFEDSTDATLEGATVTIPSLGLRRATDRTGRADFANLAAGSYEVRIAYRGLPSLTETATVATGDLTVLQARLGARPVTDEPVELEAFLDTIVITNEDISQQIEQNALNISDVIASDTMGQLPDRTVADAIRRLPGISVERAPGQPQNEYVTIRGLYSDFNSVKVDGVAITISNADGASRSVPLNVISSSTADTIEVTKSVTPEMDGDSIGGAINIRTKNAFDYGDRYFTIEGGIGYSAITDDFEGDYPAQDYFPSVDFTFSDFLNEERTLGINVSGNYSENTYIVSEVVSGGYDSLGGLFFPTSTRLQEVFEDVERAGVSTALEWRPDYLTTIGVKYSFSRTDTDFTRQRQTYFNSGFFNPPVNNDGSNYTDYIYDGFVDKQVAYFEDRQDVHVITLDVKKEVGQWTFTGKGGFNHSNYREDPDESFRGTLSQFSTVVDFEYDARGDRYFPDVRNPGFDEEDINNYDALLNADQITFDITDREWVLSGDAKRVIDLADATLTVKAGAKARFRERDFGVTRRSFGFADIFGEPAIPGLVADYEAKSRVDGNYGGTFYLDPGSFLSFVNQLERDGSIAQDTDDILREALAEYDAEENIYALYGQGLVEFGKFSVLGGVRVELTDVEFQGSVVDFVNSASQTIMGKKQMDFMAMLFGRDSTR